MTTAPSFQLPSPRQDADSGTLPDKLHPCHHLPCSCRAPLRDTRRFWTSTHSTLRQPACRANGQTRLPNNTAGLTGHPALTCHTASVMAEKGHDPGGEWHRQRPGVSPHHCRLSAAVALAPPPAPLPSLAPVNISRPTQSCEDRLELHQGPFTHSTGLVSDYSVHVHFPGTAQPGSRTW